MPTWLIVVIVVLVVLAVGGVVARTQQLKRTRPAFERSLSKADQELAAAAAADRGWDRAVMEAAARRAYAARHGSEPEGLTLVEVLDRPGTDEDEAVFEAGGQRVVLGRRGDDWTERSAG
jgi:biopolymer transport protein ExbB/TolQ